MKRHYVVMGGIGVVFLLMIVAYSTNRTPTIRTTITENVATSTSKDGNHQSREFYNMPPKERNTFLYQMNAQGEYRSVLNATNDGIQNYKETIWKDTDFWNHRGFALYKLGNCSEAGVAFWHVLMLDPENKIASSFVSAINQGCHDPR